MIKKNHKQVLDFYIQKIPYLKEIKYLFDMLIKLIVIIIITNIFILYEGMDTRGILSMLEHKLNFILIITACTFCMVLPNLFFQKLNSRKWLYILKISVMTSIGTVIVATGFLFGMAINRLIYDVLRDHDVNSTDSIRTIFGDFFLIWIFVIGCSYILEKILENLKHKNEVTNGSQ